MGVFVVVFLISDFAGGAGTVLLFRAFVACPFLFRFLRLNITMNSNSGKNPRTTQAHQFDPVVCVVPICDDVWLVVEVEEAILVVVGSELVVLEIVVLEVVRDVVAVEVMD